MYAIVEIAGQQFKVEAGREIFVNRLEGKQGDKVEFSEVLLTADGDKISVGTPSLKTKVKATILSQMKGDKVIVFKKKRRKGYQVKNGHRQYLTKLSIDSIS
ncbi:MAG: 50S ribosomal protein L21 [Chitinophagales bacterium]